MGTSTAWNADGDVEKVFGVPWLAMRKSYLAYFNVLRAITKLTLNSVTYDFEKQATEGLVVCGKGYTPVTFFLPDNREPMTSEQGASMTINSYFQMLGSTDYAVIPAWDYFAQYVSQVGAMLEDPTIEFPYTITCYNTGHSTSGSAAFGMVKTAKEFFAALANSLGERYEPLSDWMEEDGAVHLTLWVGSDQTSEAGAQGLNFELILGRK